MTLLLFPLVLGRLVSNMDKQVDLPIWVQVSSTHGEQLSMKILLPGCIAIYTSS
jgi:hypothetical protein